MLVDFDGLSSPTKAREVEEQEQEEPVPFE